MSRRRRPACRPTSCSRPRATTSGSTSPAWAATRDGEVPIIVRGDGCYLEDANGKRYLDALAGLFAVQIGYCYGDEVGEAAAAQMRELPFYTNWSYAHPRAIELAAEVAVARAGRPEPRLLRLRRLGGGRVGVEARAAVPRGARRAALEGDRAPRRLPRDDDGRALDQRHPRAADAVRAARARGRSTSATRTATTGPPEETEEEFTAFLLDDLEQTIDAAGPETVAMVIMEPVQNAGGAFTPPAGYWRGRARDLRPLRHPALRRRGDHRLRPRSAPGSARSATTSGPTSSRRAKGLSSAYASIGAVIATDAVMEPFLEGDVDVHARDHVRRPSGRMRRSRSRTSRS